MKITKEQVDKRACEDGRAWFAENFPQGGEYSQIIQTLNAHKHYEWARWGASQAYDLFLLGKTTAEFIKAETSLTDAMVEELNSMELPTTNDALSSDNGEDDTRIGSSGDGARIGSSGGGAQIGSSGDWARIGSSGGGAQIGSSGDGARIGSSGGWARIGSSGGGARIGSSGVRAQIGSSGDGAQIGSSGDGARIGSSGVRARIGSSGDGARIGSSGVRAQIGSSGDWARIGSSGVRAQIGSSGDWARIEATGKDSVIASSGSVEYVILGEGGCAVVPYNDGERVRFAIAYVGENGIQAGVKYQVNDEGAFTELVEGDE